MSLQSLSRCAMTRSVLIRSILTASLCGLSSLSHAGGDDPCSACVQGLLRCESGTVLGQLAEGDCLWPDDTFYDAWRLEVSEPTRVSIQLSADFNTFLFFTGSACETIRTNDNCIPDERESGSCIEADVPAGTYFVLANGFNVEDRGSYRLSIACDEIRTCSDCLVGELDCGQSVDGELLEPPLDCDLGDGSPLDVWQLDLPEAGRVVVQMSSDDIDSLLYLFGSDCLAFAANNSAVPQVEDARIIADLPAGTYFVGANAFRRSGAYRLSATCIPGFDVCSDCVVGELSCENPSQGELTAADCLSADNGQAIDLYSLEVTEPGRYSIELSASSFDAVLEVFDDSCGLVATSDGCSAGDLSTSCLTIDLSPGTYAVGVRSEDPRELGSYVVETRCEIGFDFCVDCLADSLVCGERRDGVLFKASCTTPSSDAYIDLYPFTLEERASVLVEMESNQLDSFIWLYDESCRVVAMADRGADGNDAALLVELEAGDYRIGASSATRKEVGEYSISLRCLDRTVCQDCTDGELRCGEPVSADLGAEDCAFGDSPSSDSYRLLVDTTSTFDIEVSSVDLVPLVAVVDELCEPVAISQTCDGGEAAACLSRLVLEPGAYTVVVASSPDGPPTGAYELSATCKTLDICAHCVVDEISCGSAREESISTNDCPFSDGSFVDAWTLTIDRLEVIRVDLESSEFDPFLFLVDANCRQILATDDCSSGGADRACIDRWLDPGTYHVVVKPAAPGQAGDYTLRVDCQTPAELCVDCQVAGIECDQRLRGSFPRSEGCTSPRGRPVDLYSFSLEEDSEVSIGVNAVFDTFLHVFDADCAQIASNDDGGAGSNSRIEARLVAGTYHVGVSAFETEAQGDVDLFVVCGSSWFERACSDCVLGSVSCDSPLRSSFPRSECWSSSFVPLDPYRFELSSPATVRFELEAAFDTQLYVFDDNCQQLAFDDNGGAGNGSLSELELDPGTYFVGVSAARVDLSGEFTLRVDCDEVDNFCPDCVVDSVACADRSTIEFPRTECQSRRRRPMDLYSVTLSQEDEVTVRVTTADFDPSVYAFDSLCREIGFDDDGGQGLNAALTLKLSPGRYYFGVSSFSADAGGDALLEILCRREGVCAECSVGSVAPGDVRTGSLPTSGCTATLGEHLDVWELQLDRPYSGDIRVVVDDEVFDPTLTLYSGGCTVLDFNDDDILGFNSLLSVDLQPGRYFLKVSTLFVGDGGPYRLSLSEAAGVGPFLRGDFDSNGALQLTDAVGIFNFLFLGGSTASCTAAADASRQGTVNLTSGVFILNFLFTGGPAPLAPFPDCGISLEVSDELLGCETAQSCQ